MFARWLLGLLLAVCPLAGHALGLGSLQMKSALNQPLNAEIDITSITESELKGLNVSLASRADFEAAGADRIPLLSQIKFTVLQRPDGRYYLQLRTDAALEEPFLHMLLQIEWPGGRLVREYTALIDPPSYVAGRPATVESPQAAAPAPIPSAPTPGLVQTVPPPAPGADTSEARIAAPAAPVPEPLPAPSQESQSADFASPAPPRETVIAATPTPADRPSQAAAPSQPDAADPATDWSSVVEYTVRPGDTLWSIAERARADKQLTLEQVILAIFRNNPDAFFRNNVNNLRAGKVLTLPERDAVQATPRADARREFRAQYDAWQEYKLRLAAGSATLKVADSAAEPPAEAPSADAVKADAVPEEPRPAQSDELLKIVRTAPDEAAAGDKSAEAESTPADENRERSALEERVTTLEESLQSKQLENRELTEKVGQVRSQIKNEKRLIELENQALAQQTAKPAETTSEAPQPTVTAKAPAPAEPNQSAAAAPAKPVKAPPKRPAPAPAPAPEEKSLVDSILEYAPDNSLLPLVGAVVVLVGGLTGILYMRRRRRSIAEFEESILASDAIATDAVATTGEISGQATSGDTSFLSDFSKGGMGQVHTDEVDPVAEAEVYLAYGRDETAEEILKEAVVKNPDRHELKQKLLEIYHQRNDVNAFETLAEELYAAVGGRGGKSWEKVEEMGSKLNPNNPMFRGGAPERRAAVAQAPAAASARFGEQTEDMAMVASAGGGMGASAAAQVADSTPSIDFDFDTAPAAAPAADMPASASADNSLDFDLNTDDLGLDRPAGKSADGLQAEVGEFEALELDTPADNVIDFDTGKNDVAAAEVPEPEFPSAGGDDEIKWELDAPMETAAASEATNADAGGNGADGQWDETATKLDLAKAYIDMGDAEGARSILDEVLAEGNEQQKKQAAELAAQIA